MNGVLAWLHIQTAKARQLVRRNASSPGHPPVLRRASVPEPVQHPGRPQAECPRQVLRARGCPIKGVYSASELGSIGPGTTPGVGNPTGVQAFGRNASAEGP